MKAASKLLVCCVLLVLAGCDRETGQVQPEASAVDVSAIPPLSPLPGLGEQAPDPGTPELVRFTTDGGEFLVAVYPQAAPNAAERFLRLVEVGYYDNTPVSRVEPGFVTQFGINWRSDYRFWRDNKFEDDPSWFAFERGTLSFAKAAPNSSSTQVFVNYGNNNGLTASRSNFAVFAKVVDGMEVVENFSVLEQLDGNLDQSELWSKGATYLSSLPVQPSMILDARRIR